MKLIEHIEYLLTRYDCLVVPGFGGIVLLNEEAAFSDDNTMLAPTKLASFNPNLLYNDGLLANSLMRKLNIEYAAAMQIIDSEVKEWNHRLLKGEVVTLGTVGSFRLSADGQINFTPESDNFFNLSMFGFADLNLKTIEELEAEDKRYEAPAATPDVLMIPINLRVVRRVVSVACLIVGLLLVSHPIEQGNIPQSYASIISSRLLNKAIVPNVNLYDEALAQDIKTSLDEDYFADQPVEEAYEGPSTIPADTVETPSQETVEPAKPADLSDTSESQPKRFYIIVASFPTEDLADKSVAKLKKQGFERVEWVFSNNKYRVSVSSFEKKSEANEFMEDFKSKNPTYDDAWMMMN